MCLPATLLMSVDRMFYVDFHHALREGICRTPHVAFLFAWSVIQLKERHLC